VEEAITVSATRRAISEDGRLANLVDALQLAAAGPEQQAGALPAFRRIAAEIRSGKSVALLDEQLRRENLLPEEVASAIRRIDELFDILLQQDDQQAFSASALQASPLWREMRAVARRALDLLGVPLRPPPGLR
jgi:hypothetical protein